MSNSDNCWQSRTLGELAKTTSGGTPKRNRKDYYGGSIPWVKSGELNDGYICETEEYITEKGLNHSSAKVFPSGTVLIALYGATVGKTSILQTTASTNQAVCGITPGPHLDANYLRYYLISIREELLSHRYGGAQPNISQQIVRNQKISYPPLPEQKKISHILSTVQRAIEAQERIIQTTTELKKALMHKLFTEGLRNEPQKEIDIGLVPESWEVVEIGDTFKFTSGKSKPKDTAPEPSDNRIVPVYGGNGILGYSAKRLLNEKVLILGRVGEYCGCAHLTTPTSWVTDNALYAKEKKRPINLKYARTHFEYLNLNQYSNKMGQPLITQGIINRVKFGLPSSEEQDELAKFFETLDTRIGLIKAKRKYLKDLFRILLHELMNAKTRVHKLEITA